MPHRLRSNAVGEKIVQKGWIKIHEHFLLCFSEKEMTDSTTGLKSLYIEITDNTVKKTTYSSSPSEH